MGRAIPHTRLWIEQRAQPQDEAGTRSSAYAGGANSSRT
jgi:hypothetical protein